MQLAAGQQPGWRHWLQGGVLCCADMQPKLRHALVERLFFPALATHESTRPCWLFLLIRKLSHAARRKLIAIGASDAPAAWKTLQRLPLLERFAAELLQLFIGKAVPSGADGIEGSEPVLAY